MLGMLLSERTGRAIEACYDAVLAPDRWPWALQLLGESLGAESCTFATGNTVEDPFRMPRSDGHEDFAQLWLLNQPHAPDPHADWIRLRRRSDRPFILEHDISTDHERQQLPYFHETARPGNRDWWASACFSVEGRFWCLPLYRGAKRGPFTVREARYFSRVGPHLSRVIALGEKLAEADIASGVDLLQQLGTAAMVIDAAGVARHLNASAERLLGTDFSLVRGRPVAGDRASNQRLQLLLAMAQVTDRELPFAEDLDHRPSNDAGGAVFAAGRTVLILTDLSAPARRHGMALSVAFGLTPAEAKLAEHMASGAGIDETASSFGISRETARSQLKAVFAKTGTRTQAGLAALAARLRH